MNVRNKCHIMSLLSEILQNLVNKRMCFSSEWKDNNIMLLVNDMCLYTYHTHKYLGEAASDSDRTQTQQLHAPTLSLYSL